MPASGSNGSIAISAVVRRVQSGFLYHYALFMILGVFALMTYFVWLNK